MGTLTKIKYQSRYTGIDYTGFRNDTSGQIQYLGTQFDDYKEWIRTIYRQEEAIVCSFLIKNIDDELVLAKLDSDIMKKSISLDIDSDIQLETSKYLENYIVPKIQLCTKPPLHDKETETDDLLWMSLEL